ncbi:MAG: coiled-coil domain-containing protein [Planctomycetota bacterium]
MISQLQRLRRRARALLVVQRLSVAGASVLAVLLALVGLDYGLRLPGTFRLVLLAAGIAVLVTTAWRYLWPAVAFRPSLVELALRVERSLPRVAGRLASSVEFAMAGADQANALAARTVRETQRRWSGESAGTVVTLARTGRALAALVSVAVIVGSLSAADPDGARTGLLRLFAPYGQTEWPARTGVVSLMDQVLDQPGVYPRGQALSLRARVSKGPDDQRVSARYRLELDGEFESWREILLTHQGGGIHERFVDTNAETIDVAFSTEDARTRTERIVLVPPPEVRRASLTVSPPAYAAGRVEVVEAELGPGIDERAVTAAPALIGSAVQLRLVLNKPLPVPAAAEDRSAWLRSTLGWSDEVLPRFTVEPQNPQRWILSWALADTQTLNLNLVDRYGLTNPEPITYRIDAVEDHPPRVTITEPETDEAVLATAVVELAAEARDDVAVASLGLEAVRELPGEAASDAPVWHSAKPVDSPAATVESELDLAPLDLAEGDVVVVTGVAEDVFELDGRTHEVVRSPARRLRVISELELASQIRRELSAVRQNAIRAEALQAELQDGVIEEGVQPGLERAQAQIGERVAAQREFVDEIDQRRWRNRLEDEQLASLLARARDLLDFAGRAANRAVGSIAERERQAGAEDTRRPDGDPERREAAEEDRPIVEAQQEVREELADLIELLDRDEDTWVVTRQLEGLLAEQSRLEGETAQLSQETIGRSREDLAPDERSELDQIAERQLELRDQGRNLVDDLRERARAVQEVDPESASGMRSAAETAERRQLSRDMETASERVEQNQLRSARSSQQASEQTLQRMLEALQETKRARAEQLLRQLASLIESIERLIAVQTGELTALAAARESGDFFGRDLAMIRLNQNTQAVAGEARAAGSQARRIARALDRAADAQGAVVTALRAEPRAVGDAEEAEQRSLEQLEEALALAQALQEQVQQEEIQRRRGDLVAAYGKIAEEQKAAGDATVELARNEELDRRQLMEARRIGDTEDQIRLALRDLQDETQEIAEAAVFAHVHRLLDDWLTVISDSLWQGDVGTGVTEQQELVADSLLRLVEALEETLAQPEEFAGGQQGGGGPSGGNRPSLIPPVAELKLLRGLQEQVYDQTRDLDSRADLDSDQRSERLRELGQQQGDLRQLGQQMLDRLRPAAPAPDVPEAAPDSQGQEP